MDEGLVENELTGAIIGAAMEVHRTLGPGFLEVVYQNALAKELSSRGIPFEKEKALPVSYKGVQVGFFEADLLVDEKVIVELKASKRLSEVDEAQVINYLKAGNTRVGLLFNFGERSMAYRRFVV